VAVPAGAEEHDEGCGVGGQGDDRVGVAVGGPLRASVSTIVQRDDVVVPRELGYLVPPVADVAGVSGHEHERVARGSVTLVMQLQAVDARRWHRSVSSRRGL